MHLPRKILHVWELLDKLIDINKHTENCVLVPFIDNKHFSEEPAVIHICNTQQFLFMNLDFQVYCLNVDIDYLLNYPAEQIASILFKKVLNEYKRV